jgi:hypothetical protein
MAWKDLEDREAERTAEAPALAVARAELCQTLWQVARQRRRQERADQRAKRIVAEERALRAEAIREADRRRVLRPEDESAIFAQAIRSQIQSSPARENLARVMAEPFRRALEAPLRWTRDFFQTAPEPSPAPDLERAFRHSIVLDPHMRPGHILLLTEPEFVGRYPVRQEPMVLPADDPNRRSIGWVVTENVGVSIVNPSIFRTSLRGTFYEASGPDPIPPWCVVGAWVTKGAIRGYVTQVDDAHVHVVTWPRQTRTVIPRKYVSAWSFTSRPADLPSRYRRAEVV